MTAPTFPVQAAFLKRKIFGLPLASLLLIATMTLALALHLYRIDSIGDANTYYTAAVVSMLKSWNNFFFVAAEPGGSITVDKPPLGLWVEAVFAWFLGVSGLSVSLPNILAGVFGIPLLYHLVKKYAGELAGLIAALVMAITPVFVATNRNNTMDGMLVFTLLLAAWAFIQATETGKARWLMLGAFIVGLGFNIKMMQAFLPLPAFYALYFLASKEGWLRKTINLALATLLLVAVSLSWAIVVDLTPADQRPYIGSSRDNTVMALILDHNGGSRLVGGDGPQRNVPGDRQGPGSNQPPLPGPQSGQPSSQGAGPQGFGSPAGGPNGQGGGTVFSRETGEPGVFRFFTNPLSKQMSWLLPFALISIIVVLFGSHIRFPLGSDMHKELILWGGWLLICIVLFSMVSGIFHAYYAIMIAPALGAMVGIGFEQLWKWDADKKWAGPLLIGAASFTLAFQLFASYQYGEMSIWMTAAAILLIAGSLLMAVTRRAAYITLLGAMLVIPAYWTVMTVLSNPDVNLPTAYMGKDQRAGPDVLDRTRQTDEGNGSNVNEELLAYLQANTQDIEYLVAVPSSHEGASLILASGRPVLYLGGFGGQDDVVRVEDLRSMAANDELLYVLYGNDGGNKEDIANWLDASCFVIQQFSRVETGRTRPQQNQQDNAAQNGDQPRPRIQPLSLYMCH
jgi:4-amino-4-deoxy-L-arabinose transferase-like glycosyltransferase